MNFCSQCGSPLADGAMFCSKCGKQVSNTAYNYHNEALEQAFLDNTHRFLRWEQKAWHITHKVFLIISIIFSALTVLLFAFIPVDEVFIAVSITYFFMTGMFWGFAVFYKVATTKVDFYLQTLYSDVRHTVNRCGSIGVLILFIIFGSVGTVFFAINFARIKASRTLINNVIERQQNPNK